MTNLEKIKIGIIGAGIVVANYHLPVLNEIEGLKVVWVCDTDLSKAKKLAKKYGIKEYNDNINKLEEVDIALIAIPVGARSRYLKYFLGKKTSLLIEKPLCENILEYENIINLSKKNNNEIGVGFMRRSYHSTNELSQLFNSKTFGPVKKITASEGLNSRGLNIDNNYYQNKKELTGGGVLIETGSHLIDQVFSIFKINNFKITNIKINSNSGIDLDTKINSILFSDQQSDEIEFNFRVSKLIDLPNKILTEFQEFKISIDLSPESSIYILDNNFNKLAKIKMKNNYGHAKEIYQAFYIEWKNFIEQVKNKKTGKFCITLKSSFLTVNFIEQAYKKNYHEK